MITSLPTGSSQSRALFYYGIFILSTVFCSTSSATISEFEFVMDGVNYQYTVVATGDNFTFKFDKSPENKSIKLKAGRHVLLSIYKDSSINNRPTDAYIKERARCFVFDSHFYTYTLCFLPNEFSQKNTDRFWGYVTQIPNWKWQLTRVLIPVILVFALFFYLLRQR